MMKPQVNLFALLPPPKVPKVSFVRVLLVSVIFILCLGFFHYYERQAYQGLEKQALVLQQTRASLAMKIKRLSQQNTGQGYTPSAENIEKLRQRLIHKQVLSNYLKRYQLGAGEGFSKILFMLAKVHEPGVWLTRIHITGGGNKIYLRGYALRSNLITTYLSRLSNNPAFKKMAFEVIHIEDVAKPKPRVRFIAATHPVDHEGNFVKDDHD